MRRKKVKVRRKITFEHTADAETVALAMMGGGDQAIHKETANNYTDGQIAYRLRLAKELYGYKHGFRVAWRRGESPVFQMVKRDMLGILVQEIQRKLTPLLEHPTPKTVSLRTK